MNNRIWIVIFLILLLFIFVSIHLTIDLKNDGGYVEDIIENTMSDTTYENASLVTKKEIIYNLLSQLKKEKYILDFFYDESNYQFSFVYTDNSLGGININNLTSKIGDLPIN